MKLILCFIGATGGGGLGPRKRTGWFPAYQCAAAETPGRSLPLVWTHQPNRRPTFSWNKYFASVLIDAWEWWPLRPSRRSVAGLPGSAHS